MKKIKEIIVVEGKDDTVAVKRAVEADTIETNGSAIPPYIIEQIKLAQATRGVIILTDPDFPGQRIRNIIEKEVPGCKHAFLPKHLAIEKRGRGVGIEHASPEAIQEALKDAHTTTGLADEVITFDDLIDAGLIAGKQARSRREKLGLALKIGYANGKQLHKRLQMFQITPEQFKAALQNLDQEELK
ncbi:MAG TPA: ribonuclease M5 [Bacillus sp. (in: firmicutes)]|uniref:ribonuclease M5 n=1 Tax=Bacillus litorisediminis TaxID=2922713 RepID=UPI001FAF4874|nr:ribonuclease M5 [Bacillus litorisediminis]HWO76061.1 ribonuclease M5 [Bacillus sp. (in: firmicutes)]